MIIINCNYCGEKLDPKAWKRELKERMWYKSNTCSNGHTTTLNLNQNGAEESHEGLVKILLMEHPKKIKIKQ